MRYKSQLSFCTLNIKLHKITLYTILLTSAKTMVLQSRTLSANFSTSIILNEFEPLMKAQKHIAYKAFRLNATAHENHFHLKVMWSAAVKLQISRIVNSEILLTWETSVQCINYFSSLNRIKKDWKNRHFLSVYVSVKRIRILSILYLRWVST